MGIILVGYWLQWTFMLTYRKRKYKQSQKIHEKSRTSKCKLVQHTDFYIKKSSTNRGNKIDKKINKHHKSSCRYQNDAYQKPVSQQEAKSVKENCGKPASNTKENLQQTKQMKSEGFGNKNQTSSS